MEAILESRRGRKESFWERTLVLQLWGGERACRAKLGGLQFASTSLGSSYRTSSAEH